MADLYFKQIKSELVGDYLSFRCAKNVRPKERSRLSLELQEYIAVSGDIGEAGDRRSAALQKIIADLKAAGHRIHADAPVAEAVVNKLLEADEVDPKALASRVPTFSGTMPEDILQHLPVEFQKAHAMGGEAEWRDPYTSERDWQPIYDDDDGTWSEILYYQNYRTEGGVLYEFIMECDKDGNQEFVDEAEVGTPEQVDQDRRYGSTGYFSALDRYYRYVEETGDDQLGYLNVAKPAAPPEDEWLVAFVDDAGRPKFSRARHLGQRPPATPTNDLNAIPPGVKEYALLDANGYTEASWEDIRNEGTAKGNETVVRVKIGGAPARPASTAAIKRAARSARKANSKYLK